MAKKILLTKDDVDGFLTTVKDIMLTRKSTTRSTFRFDLQRDSRRCEITFTAIAWLKILSLVDEFSGEVQWHGLVRRLTKNSFIVDDIIVFPHEATSASVISDQKEYEKWLNALDDETFNEIRFHGHSHVNMSVHPSSVDEKYRSDIMKNFGTPRPEDDVFYIFFIINKRGDISGEVLDLSENAAYDTDEIDFYVAFKGKSTLVEFIADAKKIVTLPTSKTITANFCERETENLPKGTHSCPYCGQVARGTDDDLLCAKCSMSFGCSSISELYEGVEYESN